jgi:hypothetical protein
LELANAERVLLVQGATRSGERLPSCVRMCAYVCVCVRMCAYVRVCGSGVVNLWSPVPDAQDQSGSVR